MRTSLLQEMDTLVEPPPCSSLFSAKTDECHYVWRGLCSRLGSNIIAVFDPSTEQWSLKPTTGPQPPGEWSGCSVCVGHYLHIFGGHDGNDFVNDMYKLDLDTFQWTKVRSSGSQPIKKNGCGLVCLNKITLGCFGGFGIEGPTQPGSTFTSNGQPDRSGRTNEFHLFDVRNGNFRQRALSLLRTCMHLTRYIYQLLVSGFSSSLGNYIQFLSMLQGCMM